MAMGPAEYQAEKIPPIEPSGHVPRPSPPLIHARCGQAFGDGAWTALESFVGAGALGLCAATDDAVMSAASAKQ
jgi:hypothetical protein